MTIAPNNAERRATDLKFGSLAQQQAQHAAAVKACGSLKSKSVVDVGCGYGDLLYALPARIDYTGVEIDEDKIDACKRLWPDHEFRHSSEAYEADIVVSVAVLQAVDDMAKALADWYAAARKRLVVVSLQPWAYRDDDWIREEREAWKPYERTVKLGKTDWQVSVVRVDR